MNVRAMTMTDALHFAAHPLDAWGTPAGRKAALLYTGLLALGAGLIGVMIADQPRVVDPFLLAGLFVLATRVRR